MPFDLHSPIDGVESRTAEVFEGNFIWLKFPQALRALAGEIPHRDFPLPVPRITVQIWGS